MNSLYFKTHVSTWRVCPKTGLRGMFTRGAARACRNTEVTRVNRPYSCALICQTCATSSVPTDKHTVGPTTLCLLVYIACR